MKQTDDADMRALAIVAIGRNATYLAGRGGAQAAGGKESKASPILPFPSLTFPHLPFPSLTLPWPSTLRSCPRPLVASSQANEPWAHRQMARVRKARPDIEHYLKDSDRIVRQAAAATLSAIGDPKSVPLLVHTWRNDPIKDVRETAQDALKCFMSSQLTGPDGRSGEVQQMIEVTQILSDEVDTLRKEVVAVMTSVPGAGPAQGPSPR